MYYSRYFKRAFDVAASLLLLALFCWFFALIFLAYFLSFQFPVFFFQKRIGKGEKIFQLIKFRTLKNTSGSLHERRFWLGSFLRYFSLDEFPQLWNVLRGEMSLIGPRPLPVEYLPFFSEEQRKRHAVRPGITGWVQVNGRHDITWEEKFSLDLYYIRHLSLLLDIQIFFRTIVLILSFKRDTSLDEPPLTKSSNSRS